MGAFKTRCTKSSKSNLLVPVMALLACGTAMAQSPTYKVGRPPTEAELRTWDNVVGSEGKELPPGSGTAKEGAKIYATKCAFCHGKTGTEGPAWRLVGGTGTLSTPTPVMTAGSYWPFATTIWDYINRTMPRDAEGSLRPDEVYALTAFLLYRNDIIKEGDVIDTKSLLELQMPNRNGFYPSKPEATAKNGNWKPHWNQAKPKPAAAR
jgi:mono/diheme cytochrome c family protein